MPNWCHTSLTVTGPTEDISRFIKGLKEHEQENEGRMSILHTYYPTPKELDIAERFGNVPEDLDKQYAANTEKFGVRSWYDWNCANWGSKWADCETSLNYETPEELMFSFETAWSPISEGIKHVSSLFPTLGFVMSYDEEAGFYIGAEAYLAGEQLYFRQEEPEYPDQKDDEDDDAFFMRLDEGRYNLRSQIEGGAEDALFTALEAVG